MKESSSDLNIIFGLQFQKIFLRFQGCPTIDQTFHVNAASLRITRLGSSNDFFNFNKTLFTISDAYAKLLRNSRLLATKRVRRCLEHFLSRILTST